MGARILVVEHEQSHREEVFARLDGSGHEIVGAENAKSGIAAARRVRPDLILCGIAPPSDGTHLLLMLRIDRSFDHVPIVAVTRFAQERGSLLNIGFSGVIPKPLPETFVSEVEGFLRR